MPRGRVWSFAKHLLLLDRDIDRRLIFIALAMLLVIALFQLDSGPKGPGQHYPDSEVYISMVGFFNSNARLYEHSIRTTRILAPLIVSFMPL